MTRAYNFASKVQTSIQPQKPYTHIIHHILGLPQPSHSFQNPKFPNGLENPPNFKTKPDFLTPPPFFIKHQNFQKNLALKSITWPFPSWPSIQILNISRTSFGNLPVSLKYFIISPQKPHVPKLWNCDHFSPSAINQYTILDLPQPSIPSKSLQIP